MERPNLSQALSTLRIKEQDFDYNYFAADSFRIQDIVDKTYTSAVKLERGAAANEASQNWDQISNLLSSFQR
jgi:hypothetical protein